MTIFRDLFGRPAPVGVIKTLEVLDCSDIMELAGMYGTLSTSFVRDTIRIARGEQ